MLQKEAISSLYDEELQETHGAGLQTTEGMTYSAGDRCISFWQKEKPTSRDWKFSDLGIQTSTNLYTFCTS